MAKTRVFDAAEYLDTPEMIAAFLNEAFETGDGTFIVKAIGTAARAKGMANISREANLSRENLYRTLSGNTKPEFDTILKVLNAMGVTLMATPKDAA